MKKILLLPALMAVVALAGCDLMPADEVVDDAEVMDEVAAE